MKHLPRHVPRARCLRDVSQRKSPVSGIVSVYRVGGPELRFATPCIAKERDSRSESVHRMRLESALVPLLLASLNSGGVECCGLGSVQVDTSNQGIPGSVHLKSDPGPKDAWKDADGDAAELFFRVHDQDGRLSIAHGQYRNVAPKLLLEYHRSSPCSESPQTNLTVLTLYHSHVHLLSCMAPARTQSHTIRTKARRLSALRCSSS